MFLRQNARLLNFLQDNFYGQLSGHFLRVCEIKIPFHWSA